MADDVTLLPCKCGTWPEVSQEPYTRRVAIFCAGCGEVTRFYDTASEAYDAWNEARRNDAVAERDARIAALEAELAAIKARRCETCKYVYHSELIPTRWVCVRLNENFEVSPDSDFCSRWQDREAADAGC